MSQKVLLAILDGWGLGSNPEVDAISQADTPFYDSLQDEKLRSQLLTHGENVGLPENQMGNSEVGHMNIGAGRIIDQNLSKIDKSIADGSIFMNENLIEAVDKARDKGKIHLMGLLSDGGVHSHINHLFALIDVCEREMIDEIYVHVILDGRDTDPNSGVQYLSKLRRRLAYSEASISTVIGRYYAMDRDKRWDRTKKAYDVLTKGYGSYSDDIINTVNYRYEEGETDEFMKPIRMHRGDDGLILNGDVVIMYNFRSDRPRQLVDMLTQNDHEEQGSQKLDLDFYTMTRYDDSYENISVFFDKVNLDNTLGHILSENGKSQLRIAETEKYPHVTYFFSGGNEDELKGESRIMIPSPDDVDTYDQKPEMSAEGITDACIEDIKENTPDFICLNYANADMVGHTGVFSAAVQAAETVDTQLKRLCEQARENDYCVLVMADHGNSDIMINEDGTPNTAHTKNPVPLIIFNNKDQYNKLEDGILADVAPTILKIMDIEVPEIMDGDILVTDE